MPGHRAGRACHLARYERSPGLGVTRRWRWGWNLAQRRCQRPRHHGAAEGSATGARQPRLARASATLAVVAEALLQAREWGAEDEVRVCQVREAIEVRLPRSDVRTAVDTVNSMLPPPGALPEPDWRAELAKKTRAVAGRCRMLTSTIEFDAEGAPVLAAMKALGEQLAAEARWSTKNPRIHPKVVTGPWKHLAFGHPARPDPSVAVDRGAYIFCVLEQFCLAGLRTTAVTS